MDEPTRPIFCSVCETEYARRWEPKVTYTPVGRIVQERVLVGYCDRCHSWDTSAGRVVVKIR